MTHPSTATLERMRALRTKAESLLSTNPEDPEGLAFQEQYLKLLARHSLDNAAFDQAAPTAAIETVTYAFPAKRWASKYAQTIHWVCNVFELPHHYIILEGQAQHDMRIVGPGTSIEAAIAVIEYLLPQLTRFDVQIQASAEYQAHRGHTRRSYASDAMDTWIATVAARVRKAYAAAKADQATEAPDQANRAALVLADHFTRAQQQLDSDLEQMQQHGLNRVNNVPALRYRDEQAFQAGMAAGNAADIGIKRMGNPPRRALSN